MLDTEVFLSSIGRVKRGAVLAQYTTWHIGGPAEYIVEPEHLGDIPAIYAHAADIGVPVTLLGRGSNVLIDDSGVSGIVVCLRNRLGRIEARPQEGLLVAEAGCSLRRVALTAGHAGMAGFEFLIGIPGAVGGGIVTNAGTGGSAGPSLKDLLTQVTVYDIGSGSIGDLPAAELNLAYRRSSVIERGLCVLKAEFRTEAFGSVDDILSRHKELIRKRRDKQPPEPYTCGSVFKQPEGGHPAGWYMERMDLKGYRIGGARISTKHANWIVNDGTASASDVRQLMEVIRNAVSAEFGIDLETEVHSLPTRTQGVR